MPGNVQEHGKHISAPPFSSHFFEYCLSFRFPGGPGVPEGSRKSVGFKIEKIVVVRKMERAEPFHA